MKNPLFRAQVEALFKKTSFFQDPRAVAAANPKLRGKIHRGLNLLEDAGGAARAVGDIAGAGYRGVSKFLTPSSKPGIVSRGITGAGNFFLKSPRLMKATVGAAALAPILGNAFDSSRNRYEAELMNAYADPSRVIIASLQDFLEKKAARHCTEKHAAAPKVTAVGEYLHEGIGKGFGTRMGEGMGALLSQAVSMGFNSAHDALVGNARRKALVGSILRADPILSDALQRHPDSKKLLDEAYATMVRFAPTLSLDVNAVRSFLREAVLGGSGVNYATIKNLVDTERAIADAHQAHGGY